MDYLVLKMSDAIMELIPSELNRVLILEVGCAKGYLGYRIRGEKTGDPTILGLDIWIPYIKDIKEFHFTYAHLYNDLIIADARYMPFRDHVFNLLIASEILEHLTRRDGFELLNELERICNNRIITSTPSRFIEQGEIDDNPYQRHISLWKEEDLIKLGYETKVVYPKLPRALEIVDKIRRLIFQRSKPLGVIVAWKNGVGRS